MKTILSLILISISILSFSQSFESDYRIYHSQINEAEEMIFINQDSVAGIKLFAKTFNDFDFVFVDDCIEAFQLALLFKQEDYALKFIKKAMDNGFRLEILSSLDCGCPHNFYNEIGNKVTVYDNFMKKYNSKLKEYEKTSFKTYLKRIDKDLLKKIIDRHIREQLYKDFIPEKGLTKWEYEKQYEAVKKDNLDFIESQFKNGNFIGERNIGFIDLKVLEELDIPYLKDNKFLEDSILNSYGLPANIMIPVKGKSKRERLDDGMLYIIFYHNTKSYNMLSKYKDDAIQKGYLHPREYASLQVNKEGTGNQENRGNKKTMFLNNYYKEITETKEINRLRTSFLLPKYEVDYKKHELMHKHCLKLHFGFFNGTK